MPTPESAMFLAAKPKVPPTFDGVDYDDTKRLKQAQDAIIREQWVQVMMGRLIHDELRKCYMREGANHLENCGHLRGQFLHCGPMSLDIHERTSAMVDFRPQKTLDEVTNFIDREILPTIEDVPRQGLPVRAAKLLLKAREGERGSI